MKNKPVIVALVCLTVLCLSVPVLAQGELSLEGLSEQLRALTNKVTALTERVDSIEALWINSEPLVLADGACITGSRGGMQDATVLKYKEAFDAWPATDQIQLFAANYDSETGIVALQYDELLGSKFVIEFWQGCEFLGSTDWWEGGWSDDPFDPPLGTGE